MPMRTYRPRAERVRDHVRLRLVISVLQAAYAQWDEETVHMHISSLV
jgi:hypothetical protein